jgi:hypothetical protein
MHGRRELQRKPYRSRLISNINSACCIHRIHASPS